MNRRRATAAIVRTLTLSAALAGAAPAFAQPSIEGLWRTPVDHGEVRIEACGAEVCGYVVRSDFLAAHPGAKDVRNRDAALRGRRIEGLKMLSGFTGGPKAWAGGHVYNPSDGGTYTGRIVLADADTLKLRGCIFFPLCQTQTWTRVR